MHTTGPWTMYENTVGIGVTAPDGDVAACDLGHSARTRAEEIANARMMAASLDMHTTGKALVDRDCRYEGGLLIIPCGSHADAIRLLHNFRRALDKATA